MTGNTRIYRKALPYWVALVLLAAVTRLARPLPVDSLGGGRLLAGIEPITVIRAILERPRQLGQVMLCLGLPALSRWAGEQDPLFREDLSLAESFWTLSVGVRYHSPQETLRAGLPILGIRTVQNVPKVRLVAEHPTPRPGPMAAREPVGTGTPDPGRTAQTVIIFHTHSSESYLPISGRDHLENGAGDIELVGEYLTQALQAEGLVAVHDRTLHDQTPFRDAYRRSLVTAEKLVVAYPNPLALIDLHRDATPGVVGTIELGGEKVARLALVVGTDRLGLGHPRWRDNLAFANALRDASERLYPGFLARIDLAEARYNQHLHPHAIIVEIGNQYSTATEVYRAAACLARILAEVASFYTSPVVNTGVPPATAAGAPRG